MTARPDDARVVVLAPMPLEMRAIVTAFGLEPAGEASKGSWAGRVGRLTVTAVHVGMGPASTRAATSRVLEETGPGHQPVAHVMVAGICGGLSPDLPVGTLLNPDVVVDHGSGLSYRHNPPGDLPRAGKLVTTEGVSLDPELCRRFLDDGCLGVDMESAAVAEVCEGRGCPWSVYRCIGDRPFDGLLDERIVAATRPDGSPDLAEIGRLLEADPGLATKLEQLGRDAALAARLAAEAAARACLLLGA